MLMGDLVRFGIFFWRWEMVYDKSAIDMYVFRSLIIFKFSQNHIYLLIHVAITKLNILESINEFHRLNTFGFIELTYD